MVINKTHPNLPMENPTPGFSFSCIIGSVSGVSINPNAMGSTAVLGILFLSSPALAP